MWTLLGFSLRIKGIIPSPSSLLRSSSTKPKPLVFCTSAYNAAIILVTENRISDLKILLSGRNEVPREGEDAVPAKEK